MADRKGARMIPTGKKAAQAPAKAAAPRQASQMFTDEERGAMKARVKEIRAGDADSESQVLEKIAELKGSDRTMAERLHSIIKSSAPMLTPKLWYGMPAYAREGKIICHFQSAQKFKTRYATLGFSDNANLDEGAMWPVAFALKGLSGAEEAGIRSLLKKAVG